MLLKLNENKRLCIKCLTSWIQTSRTFVCRLLNQFNYIWLVFGCSFEVTSCHVCLSIWTNKLCADEKKKSEKNSFNVHCWATEKLGFHHKLKLDFQQSFTNTFCSTICWNSCTHTIKPNKFKCVQMCNCFVQSKLKCSLFIHLEVISNQIMSRKSEKLLANVCYLFFLCSQHPNIFNWNCNWQCHTPHQSCTLQ